MKIQSAPLRKGSSLLSHRRTLNHQSEQGFCFAIRPAAASPLSASDQASSRVGDIVVSLSSQAKALKSATSAGSEAQLGDSVCLVLCFSASPITPCSALLPSFTLWIQVTMPNIFLGVFLHDAFSQSWGQHPVVTVSVFCTEEFHPFCVDEVYMFEQRRGFPFPTMPHTQYMWVPGLA
ncbi:hypothetical protein F0562_013421 [Nyssa sinensis]|uniref:Uncharacterized protein n=1 Tax=Nyssa sinensis TaxID=561372 RepID=A0A5J4ZKN2_9ASTE|nr:hypothetical protein F0562_013421 [Nyssa sinensis]